MIKRESQWKGVFDIIMLCISCYNIFGNAYFSAFGVSDTMTFWIADQVIESFFLLDLAFCFCQEYLDEETYTIVSDIKKIALHYLKRSFIFDLLAWIPFQDMILYTSEASDVNSKARLFRLLKLLRLPRLAQLLDVEQFKQIVHDHYNQQLERNIKQGNENSNYPIMRALLIVQFYRIVQLVIIIFGCSYFLGIFWHIIVKDLETTEPSLNDVFNGGLTFYTYPDYGL